MVNYKKKAKISKKERRIILRYLRIHNSHDELPKDYKGYNGVTMIKYGFMGSKFISVAKIAQIAKEEGFERW